MVTLQTSGSVMSDDETRAAEVLRVARAIRAKKLELRELEEELEELLDSLEDSETAPQFVQRPRRTASQKWPSPRRGTSTNEPMTTRLLAFLRANPGRGYTPAELATVVGSTNSASIRQLVLRFEKSGKVEKLARGRWGIEEEKLEEPGDDTSSGS